MRRQSLWLAIAIALVVVAQPSAAQVPAASGDNEKGVTVGRPSFLRRLVSAEKLEQQADAQFVALKRTAVSKNALVPPNHPQFQRLLRIQRDLLPHTAKWNDRAKEWKWEVQLISSQSINAFCMPGGKIAFFSGIIDKLKLTDDEIAIVMGHEIAHALREHARERAAKTNITQIGGRIIGALILGQAGEVIGAGAGSLLTLKFSRDDEKEADLVGMEIAARAGYDPAAGITLWEKMSKAAQSAPPQWLSTHPSSQARVDLIKKHLHEVANLYQRAKAAREAGAGASPMIPVPRQSPATANPLPTPATAGDRPFLLPPSMQQQQRSLPDIPPQAPPPGPGRLN